MTSPVTKPEVISEAKPEVTSEPEVAGISFFLFATIYVIIIVLIYVGNVVTIIVILKSKHLRRSNMLYVLSLAFSDVMIACFVVPSGLLALFDSQSFVTWLCKICHFCRSTSEMASIYGLVLITGDRFHAVTYPLQRQNIDGAIKLTIVLSWIFAAMYSLRALVEYKTYQHRCTVGNEYLILQSYFSVLDLFMMCIIPFVLIIIMNVVIIKKISSRHKRNEENEKQTNTIIKTVIFLTCLFGITQLPHHIYDVYVHVVPYSQSKSATIEMSLNAISWSNSWLNVFGFAYLNKRIREALLGNDVIRCFRIRNRQIASTSNGTTGNIDSSFEENNI